MVDSSILQLLNIEDTEKIRQYDEKDGLQLYHYTECSQDSDENLKKVRGVVVKDGKIVCRSFPYTPEICIDEIDKVKQLLPEELTGISLCQAYEGTILRAFYQNDQWYFSTHRKIDATLSKWAGPTFLEIFDACLEINYKMQKTSISSREELCNKMNPNHVYIFLASNHPQNLIACNSEDPTLYHLVTYDENLEEIDEDLGLLRQHKFQLATRDELVQFVHGLDQYSELSEYGKNPGSLPSPGVIAFTPNGPVKIVSSHYRQRCQIRGNEASLRVRYLQLRNDKEKIQQLYEMFPENEIFDKTEEEISRLCSLLHSLYMHRFVFKETMTMPQEEYVFLQQCHSWHLEDKKQNKVYPDIIIERMKDMNPVYMNRMLKRLKKGILDQLVYELNHPVLA